MLGAAGVDGGGLGTGAALTTVTVALGLHYAVDGSRPPAAPGVGGHDPGAASGGIESDSDGDRDAGADR